MASASVSASPSPEEHDSQGPSRAADPAQLSCEPGRRRATLGVPYGRAMRPLRATSRNQEHPKSRFRKPSFAEQPRAHLSRGRNTSEPLCSISYHDCLDVRPSGPPVARTQVDVVRILRRAMFSPFWELEALNALPFEKVTPNESKSSRPHRRAPGGYRQVRGVWQAAVRWRNVVLAPTTVYLDAGPLSTHC